MPYITRNNRAISFKKKMGKELIQIESFKHKLRVRRIDIATIVNFQSSIYFYKKKDLRADRSEWKRSFSWLLADL